MVAPLISTAVNAAKTIVKKAAKKASRPKTAADERYNERRRAIRAAERLEKKAQLQSGKIKQETLKHVKSLKQAVKDSYFNRKTKQYNQTITQLELQVKSGREYAAKIAEQTRELSARENVRINRMVSNYFSQAVKSEAQRAGVEPVNPRQRLIQSQKNFFYGATKQLWFGGSAEMRNENILYGMRNFTLESGKRVQNLQDAIMWVKEHYPDRFPTDESENLYVSDTFADSVFSEEVELEDDSPPIISLQAFRAAGWRP